MTDITDRVTKLLKTFEGDKDPHALEQAAELVVARQVDKALEPRERREHLTRLWFSVLNHLDRHRDPNFNYDDVPELSVAPPLGPGMPSISGMDPQSVTDPVLRRDYEEAIERNRQKAERYRFQKQLQKVDRRFSRQLEAYLRSAYSQSPADVQELSHSIENQVESAKRKNELKKLLP